MGGVFLSVGGFGGVGAAVVFGGAAVAAAELAGKEVAVGEAGLVGDFGDAGVGLGEEGFGFVEALADEVFDG